MQEHHALDITVGAVPNLTGRFPDNVPLAVPPKVVRHHGRGR